MKRKPELVHEFKHLGHSVLDFSRSELTGIEEVVFAGKKNVPALIDIVRSFLDERGRVLVTKLSGGHLNELRSAFPDLLCDEDAGIVWYGGVGTQDGPAIGRLLIVSAGTSDRSVSMEAFHSAAYFGFDAERVEDVGVASIGRILELYPRLETFDVIVVVAGMEGALPSVVSGMCRVPIIAVPTSVGYGASFDGIAALLGMLNSCSPGVTVVNIDNGFGAIAAAVRICGRNAALPYGSAESG